MARPTEIENPVKLTLYVGEATRTKAHALAKKSGVSIGQQFSEFITGQSKSRTVNVRLNSDEAPVFQAFAKKTSVSLEDLMKQATRAHVAKHS